MFVSYLRVSTKEQGDSGLGLEAQRAAVTRFANGEAIAVEFLEVESGSRCDRPQLQAALAQCRKLGATLLIARLDRLARNAAFVCTLLDSDVRFIACDLPSADRTMLQMLAVFGEHERRLISKRTRDALKAKRDRGETWGAAAAPERYTGVLERARASNSERAAAWKSKIAARAREYRDAGRSLKDIAAILNANGLRTRTGKPLTPTAVLRALDGKTGGHAGRFN